MPKYGVTLYYHASLYIEVEAPTKEEAREKVEMQALDLQTDDSLTLDQDDYDVEELKEE